MMKKKKMRAEKLASGEEFRAEDAIGTIREALLAMYYDTILCKAEKKSWKVPM